MKLRAAVRALIQDLVQTLRPAPVWRAYAALLLPGEVVVLKGLDDAAVDLLRLRRGEFLRLEEQGNLRLGREGSRRVN